MRHIVAKSALMRRWEKFSENKLAVESSVSLEKCKQTTLGIPNMSVKHVVRNTDDVTRNCLRVLLQYLTNNVQVLDA
jgi:hypothetical protein